MSSYHLPFDRSNTERRESANARCNGETIVHYLRLYRLLRHRGKEVPEFLEVARRNARFYTTHQLGGEREGSFGRWWSADGTALDTEGTNGAHVIPVLVELERLAGPTHELDGALGRAASYYGGLVERGEYYGDTLDADCIDREAGAILLRAFLDLYERGGENRHLELAREAACYVLSWLWTYDVPFPAGSPFAMEEFGTRGMTAMSVAIQHVDVSGMHLAYDFLRLGNATGEPEWLDCARAMIDACAQLVSTPSDPLNQSRDFIGWQPEHIYQTDFNYFLAELGGKGTYDTCIAWVMVLTLGAMLDIRDRFPE